MKFEEIAHAIQLREGDQGNIITNLQSKRLVAQAIVGNFQTVGSAREAARNFQAPFTSLGYEIDHECLEWAVYMFLPIQAPEEMREIIYGWYEED